MSAFDQSPDGSDQEQFGQAMAELEKTFEEAITIKRFSSQPSTPSAFGTPQKIQFTSVAATAVVVSMGEAQSMFAEGVLQAGDLVLQMRDRLNESNENVGGSTPADRVVWRGMEYRMVQRPEPIFLDGDVFYKVLLRRTNDTGDSVGL